MDVRFCEEQEPTAERHYVRAADSDGVRPGRSSEARLSRIAFPLDKRLTWTSATRRKHTTRRHAGCSAHYRYCSLTPAQLSPSCRHFGQNFALLPRRTRLGNATPLIRGYRRLFCGTSHFPPEKRVTYTGASSIISGRIPRI
jgi:hypothetical protein